MRIEARYKANRTEIRDCLVLKLRRNGHFQMTPPAGSNTYCELA